MTEKQLGLIPVDSDPLLNECRGSYFLTTGRKFECLCGKSVCCLTSDKYVVSISRDYSVKYEKGCKFFYGLWKRLADEKEKKLDAYDIKRLPFVENDNLMAHKDFVIMVCSYDCPAVKAGLRNLEKKYSKANANCLREQLTIHQQSTEKKKETENMLYYGKPMFYKHINPSDYQISTHKVYCKFCGKFLVEYRNCKRERFLNPDQSYRFSEFDEWTAIKDPFGNVPKFNKKKGCTVCRQCYKDER